jgi:hypothetical protein
MLSIGSSSESMTASAAWALELVGAVLSELGATCSQSLVRLDDLTSELFSAKISLAWLLPGEISWATADAARGFEGVEAARGTVGQVEGVGAAVPETAGLAWFTLLRSLSLDENAMRMGKRRDVRSG